MMTKGKAAHGPSAVRLRAHGHRRWFGAGGNGDESGGLALARNSPDWHNLIYMSRYTDTLIADEHGIYDPSSPTDRMVLGLRGQMSEMELETSIHRMMAGRLHKAQRGEFLVYPPAGYDVDDLYQIVKTSDEAVCQAIRTVFAKFDELGTVKQVCAWYKDQGLKFPVRRIELRSRPVVWMEPVYRMFLYVLHHPIYAGAYVFGRTKTVRQLDPDDPRRLHTHHRKVDKDDWPVLIRDHHPGYIDWVQFEQNQKRIADNKQMKRHDNEVSQGPVREGWALLQGWCAAATVVEPCMSATEAVDLHPPRRARCSIAVVPYTEHMVGLNVRLSVANRSTMWSSICFWPLPSRPACKPPSWLSSTCSTSSSKQSGCGSYKSKRLNTKRSAPSGSTTRSKPENRVVARTLETRWNAALEHVEQLKTQALAHRQQIRPLSEHEQARARRLATDLHAVW